MNGSSSLDVDTLPPEIVRALESAFGDAKLERTAAMPGGFSGATLLSLDVAGRGYVVRRPNPSRPRDELRAPREVVCHQIASELGIAPKLHYVDPISFVSIMDRIEGKPLRGSPTRGSERLERLTATLRRLHAGPAFPKGPSVGAMLQYLDQSLRAGGGRGLPTLLLRSVEQAAKATERFAESASCHNDLNPTNILETPEAFFFVDWETACLGDPFFDLAELGVFAFPTVEGRAELLEAYLQRSPSNQERARETLARVEALGFYTAGFVLALSGDPRELPSKAPPFRELLTLLGSATERPGPEVIAASLLAELEREVSGDGFEHAKRTLQE